jgi:nitrite reductase/ring-hydroxylating ferredoxin subunit/Fe-S cluster biogenesis protein NfuA
MATAELHRSTLSSLSSLSERANASERAPQAEPSDQADLQDFVEDLARLERIMAGWDDTQRGVVAAYKRAIDALHAEALRRLVRAFKAEPAALATLRAAVSDDVVYAVLRQLQIVKPSLDERIEVALAAVRPMLASHGGDVELVRVAPPMIEVRFLGACDGCAASAMTFHAGVKQAVYDACPEITNVVQIKGTGRGHAEPPVSPFALTQLGAWHYACELAELADRGVRALAIGGHELLFARDGGKVTCFHNACAHLGFRLDDGEVHDGVLTCMHHGFTYRLATGECLTAASVTLASYPARVVDARVEVKLPR